MDWHAEYARDESLRDFVAARVAEAVVDFAVARVEAAHWRAVAEAADEKLRERPADAKAQDRRRQTAHRRRHSFLHVVSEAPQ